MSTLVHENVQKYYGSRLQTSGDLQTSASCGLPSRPMPKSVLDALKLVHPEVRKSISAVVWWSLKSSEAVKSWTWGVVLGRDCYALSKLVGSSGHVIGIDMTEELILVSRKYIQYHQERFGFEKPNTVFVQGYMERLGEAGVQSDSLDILVSNCVICLCPDKKAILKEAFRVLKEGGEFYFSDMYASEVVPEHLKQDPVMWGEGMSGSLYWQDLIAMVQEVGFSTPRLVTASHIVVHNSELQRKAGDIRYASGTYRFFKLPKNSVEVDAVVTYKGTVPDHSDQLDLDDSHSFKRDVPVPVDAETAAVLRCSRFSSDFCFQSSAGQATSQNGPPQYCHLSPFLLADRLGSSIRQCSKTGDQASCDGAPPGGQEATNGTGNCGT